MNSELLEVAIIGKSVGLKGYVKLHNKSDFPQQFKNGAKFFDKNGAKYTIKHYDKTRLEALFLGFESVELAKTLTNKTLYTTIAETRKNFKLSKDEYFYFDIIGLNVVENGEILGVIEDIEQIGKDSLFFIKTSESLTSLGFAKSFYLPYLDKFIKCVNLDKKEILTNGAKAILENS